MGYPGLRRPSGRDKGAADADASSSSSSEHLYDFRPLSRGQYPVFDGFPERYVDEMTKRHEQLLRVDEARRAKAVMLAQLQRESKEVGDETERFRAKAARLRAYSKKFFKQMSDSANRRLQKALELDDTLATQRVNLARRVNNDVF